VALQTQTLHYSSPSFIGASFGATREGLVFWQRAGFSCIHFGYRLNPRSAQRAVSVALALHPSSHHQQLIQQANAHLVDTLQTLQSLRDASPPWFQTLYGGYGMHEGVLEQITESRSHTLPADDALRLELLRSGALQLHEVWGAVVRKVGGISSLLECDLNHATSRKSVSNAIYRHVFDQSC